jgi:hypothetical protein
MISLADLEYERAGILRSVLSALLRSDLVQNVLAQVIDGIPIESTYEFATTMRSEILSRTEPSPESMQLSRRICESDETFDLIDLNPTVWFPDNPFGGSRR